MSNVTWRCPHCGHHMQRVSAEDNPLLGAGIGVAPGRTIQCVQCYQPVEALDVIGGKHDVTDWVGLGCGLVFVIFVVLVVLAILFN